MCKFQILRSVFIMKRILKKMICVVITLCLTVSLLSTTAFAWGSDLVGLSENERFDELWEEVTQHYMGLEASLMYDELKKFVSELELNTKIYGYDVDDGYKDFIKWYENRHKGMKTELYDKEVADYLRKHPDADLDWTSGAGSKDGELRVYDKNVLIATVKDSKNRDKLSYMQYSPENVNGIIIWTYDPDKEQFVGTDENGKLVKKLTAYSKPYGYRETSKTSKPEESSVAEVSETEDISDIQESEPQEMDVVESTASTVTRESSTKTSVAEDQPDSPVHAVEESAVTTDPSAITDEKPDTASGSDTDVAEESPAEQENSSNDNSTTTIIIICGVVIAGVFAFLIIRQKKKKV